jgi:hypothetical protein
MFAHKFWGKGIFYVAFIKRQKIRNSNANMLFFSENMCANIECPDKDGNIFSLIFLHFKI